MAAMTSPTMYTAPPVRRLWLLAFCGFFLIFGAWAVAAPYDGVSDERAHVIRAAGVGGGEFAPEPTGAFAGTGAYQTVPRGIPGIYESPCWWHGKVASSVACASEPTADAEQVVKPTSAGRYNPAYYAIVGWPLQLWPGWAGLIVARLISAALSAALLAGAVAVLARWSRYGLMIGALLGASTPLVAHLSGAVNPSGLEIIAGIGFFSAAIPLLLGPVRGSLTPLMWQLGCSAVTLSTLRSMGPAWLLGGLFALLVPNGLAQLRTWWRAPVIRRWLAVIAAAILASVAWTVIMKASQLMPIVGARTLTKGQAALAEFDRWGGYLKEIVGLTSWMDTAMPQPVYLLWQYLVATLLVVAVAVGSWVDRWRLAVLFGGAAGVSSIIQVLTWNTYGPVTQGRYMMPLLVSLPLLAAFIVERHALGQRHAAALARLIGITVLPVHLVSLVFTMARWQQGLHTPLGPKNLNPFIGEWHPPLGSVLPIIAMIAGLCIVAWIAWAAPSRAGMLPDLDDTTSAQELPRQRAEVVGATR